jgi:hypothetical protein
MPHVNVFICAAGHSGSTLLDILLGAHERGLSLGELTQLPKNVALNSLCSCGNNISVCEFWRPMIDGYGQLNGIDYWRAPYRLNLGFIKASDEIDHSHQTATRDLHRRIVYGLQFFSYKHFKKGFPGTRSLTEATARQKSHFLRYISKQTNSEFVVDSSKHYLEALSLYIASPENTKVILLLRDGRAVFYSGIRRGMSPEAALATWRNHWQRAITVLSRQLPDEKIIRTRYEDIASNPQEEIGRLCTEIGIASQKPVDFASAERRHIVNGNRMRFTKKLSVSFDEKWRQGLSNEMRQYFEQHAGDLNRTLGYE